MLSERRALVRPPARAARLRLSVRPWQGERGGADPAQEGATEQGDAFRHGKLQVCTHPHVPHARQFGQRCTRVAVLSPRSWQSVNRRAAAPSGCRWRRATGNGARSLGAGPGGGLDLDGRRVSFSGGEGGAHVAATGRSESCICDAARMSGVRDPSRGNPPRLNEEARARATSGTNPPFRVSRKRTSAANAYSKRVERKAVTACAVAYPVPAPSDGQVRALAEHSMGPRPGRRRQCGTGARSRGLGRHAVADPRGLRGGRRVALASC